MEDCIKKEVQRQIELIEDGGKVVQETRLYNGDTGESRSMRSKEEANDYRYFPCPDLLPIILSDDDIDGFRSKLPELPAAKQQRFIDQYGLSRYDAAVLVSDKSTALYFEETAGAGADPKLAANWINGELAARLNANETSIIDSPVSAKQLTGLIERIADNTISNKIAKQVFESLWNKEFDSADAVIDAKGLKQVSDTGAIEQLVKDVVAANPDQAEQYRAADEKKRKKMTGFFVGQIMKASKGQANPAIVNQLLIKTLNS